MLFYGSSHRFNVARILCAGFYIFASLPTLCQRAPTAGPPHPGAQAPLPPELKKISDAYGKAIAFHKAKKYPEAIAAYEEFVSLANAAKVASGLVLSAYSNMAIIYQETNDQKHFAETLRKIIALDPTNPRPLAQLAIIESSEHNFDAAAVNANKALALKPPKDIASSAHFVKGNVAVSHKDFSTAAIEFGQSANLTPANAMAHSNFGLALAELKRYADAKK